MLIRQCLKEREVTLSCELFPPKEGRLLSEYKEIARKVAALRPTFISVTYGAGGGTSAPPSPRRSPARSSAAASRPWRT